MLGPKVCPTSAPRPYYKNIYAPNVGIPNVIKVMPLDLKLYIVQNTVIVGVNNYSLIDKSSVQKLIIKSTHYPQQPMKLSLKWAQSKSVKRQEN